MSFNIKNGERTVFMADAVILAAGSHTRIWRKSSSRRNENTGDGFYLALKAGCDFKDMEIVQFHPTGMVIPEQIAGTLVTEAVRGEGGHLKNKHGERFMKHYDTKRMELSTRDRVAMANYTETDDNLRHNFHPALDSNGQIQLRQQELEPLTKELQQIIQETDEIEDFDGMLLE